MKKLGSLLLMVSAYLLAFYGIASANVAVPAQPYKSHQTSCNLITPFKIGEWDLSGDGANGWVYYEKTALGNWANHIVVFDFQAGCTFYPLDDSLSGDPNAFYTVSALQMDGTAGNELVVRPRPGGSVGGTPTWSHRTRVIKQSTRVYYLVDYGAVGYQAYNATDYNAQAGTDISALGSFVDFAGNESYYFHVFSLLPSPAFRQYDYRATVSLPNSPFAVRPYNGVMSGQLDAQPGDEAAVLLPPTNSTSGVIYIFSDRDRSKWVGSFSGNYGSFVAMVKSATIAAGKVTVVVSYINNLTPSASYDATFQYAVRVNTSKVN
ncbi:hypothetical protein Amn_21470 [Aminobacter sp. Y103A]|uniref:hypothetical protein n=1 Tax=Aminobacter sp. Y103A TaxID=1870862 RepID=UPI0025731536|nr:hypothetical protein [Aminobacter sp. SS-2016]BBD37267.1 hypothetical protein Amn_21470 [Aminobacter sp. SS-2016]